MFVYEKPDNLVSSFEATRDRYPHRPFIGSKDKNGEYQWQSYSELGNSIDMLRGGLELCGVGAGDTVGIIANNRPEWFVVAMAAYSQGASFVPMYESELEKLWHYVVKDSTMKVLFVSTRAIYEIVSPYLVTVSTLEAIYIIDDDSIDSMKVLMKQGAANKTPPVFPAPDDVASIVYTSGTTGSPKGVMLTHGNITSNSRAGWRLYPFLKQDSTSISILPWAHSYGMTAELFCFMQFGGKIGIMGSVATLAQDIETLKPTIIIGVPRVFNKIYEGLVKKFSEQGVISRKIIASGIASGKKRQKLKTEGKKSILSTLNHSFISMIAFSKIRKRFGGNLKACLTASAPIKPEIIEFFMALGIPLYEAYGMTETSPAIAMNCANAFKIGSVGKPLEFVEVMIDKSVSFDGSDDGEILARGPNVMKGYLNKPGETSSVITSDGWVRTGDRGYLDDDNFLYITGRIKEQYKLVNGKYVFPASMEEDITHNRYISNAFVYGTGQNYNVALIVPDFKELAPVLEKKNISRDPSDLVHNEAVRAFLLRQIKINLEGEYGHYEIPKKIILSTDPFTIENGILTQTLKTKRHVILEKFGDQIFQLYND
ncbi:MAG: long-chain fatty acid--CoA ligase [Deltaproteobacteria bacterium]|nr:long-chain fatty acid--CoA ligase [Deltaproteobacteria bacterium]